MKRETDVFVMIAFFYFFLLRIQHFNHISEIKQQSKSSDVLQIFFCCRHFYLVWFNVEFVLVHIIFCLLFLYSVTQ